MASVLDIITSAMRKNGALTKSETPSADESADGLQMLNDLIGSWSTESMLVTARTTETFNLTGGVGAYTIGTGATFNTTRPMVITTGYIRSGTTDYTLELKDDETFAEITQKDIQSNIPLYLNYDNAYPTGTINIWPVPSASYTITLLSEKPLTAFSTVDETVNLAPGWNRALVYNLAEEMALEYGQPISPTLAKLANESKMAIKRSIAKNRKMDVPTFLDNFNTVYTGYYN